MDTQKSPQKPAVDEIVICQRRKHWVNIVPVLLACVILFLFLPIGSYFYGRHTQTINNIIPAGIIGSLVMVYIILVAGIALLSLWIYRQNRLVLTNHIVEYTRRGIFDRTVAQFSLIKLQDVSSAQHGLMANLLGYGNITIETAGEEENFVFAQVPRPQELANQIMQAHEALADSLPTEARSI